MTNGDGRRMSLITPATPGFRRGMLASDAVALFASTPDPILYFLLSPGDEPLLLRGVRHHPGPTVLEVPSPAQSYRKRVSIQNFLAMKFTTQRDLY